MRRHPLEIGPPLGIVIALAPQHDDSDTPVEILHDRLRIAPLHLIVAPEGLRNVLN